MRMIAAVCLPDQRYWNCETLNVVIGLKKTNEEFYYELHNVTGSTSFTFNTPPYTNWTISGLSEDFRLQPASHSSFSICRNSEFDAAPSPVRNLTVAIQDDSSFNITWDEPLHMNGILRYYLLKWSHSWRHSCDIPLSLPSWEMQVNGTTAILKALSSSRYDISVSAVTVASGDPAVVSAFTKFYGGSSVPGGKPQNLRVMERHQEFVILGWDPPLCNTTYGKIAGYQVWALVDVPWCQRNITAMVETSNTWKLDNLQPFTTYLVRVAAGSKMGISEFTADLNVTIPPAGIIGNINEWLVKAECQLIYWKYKFRDNQKSDRMSVVNSQQLGRKEVGVSSDVTLV
ncbi:hypothetical protein LAZ67_11000791 [Cordylochernes scorpioides]|uniref:Fibronectin type-III domain-containing protein n=1 Tax=Cordylochernes scorpioides TaxID=51811 RepID=A0ABY6KZS7_9ARAC|nr:hypothetical protein LAZ67_11000791 [Cordylochernes scorpioides]